MDRSRSIEQLENEVWESPSPFETGLIRRCYEYRKIPVGQLTAEQLRTLIGQKIGVKFILELIVEKLEVNIFASGDLYPGDLLMAIKTLPAEYWQINLFERFANLVRTHKSEIEAELGDKELYLLLDRLDVLIGFLKK